MSDIDFLGNKKDDDQKPKDKEDKKDKIIWSEPEKDRAAPKGALSAFIPLFAKKPWEAGKPKPPAVDKDKIKQSRQEILKLIKQNDNLAAQEAKAKAPGKNILSSWGEKMAAKKNHKEILIDYQQIFNEEKNKRSSAAPLAGDGRLASASFPESGQVKPAERPEKNINAESAEKAVKKQVARTLKTPGQSWLAKLLKLIKQKLSAFKAPKIQPAFPTGFVSEKINSTPPPKPAEAAVKTEAKPVIPAKPEAQPEVKPAEEPAKKRTAGAQVLETNLIRGEIITYFDWRQKVIVLIFAVLVPIFLVGIIYAGAGYYQKVNQAKSEELIKKFNELTGKIKQEETGLEEISAFQVKFKTISQLFSRHIYWTNFFKFLEDNTIKDVYYAGFSGDTGGTYTLDAVASSYGNISEQAKVLRDNTKVTDVQATGGELSRGDDDKETKIKFNFKFSVSKSLFTE